jgi:hypothetical protein
MYNSKIMRIASRIISLALAVAFLGAEGRSVDGVALMKIDHSAQFAGMAGAAVSLTGSPDLAVYNPASQSEAEKFAVVFGHMSYWDNIRLESAFFGLPLSSQVTGHCGIRYAGVNDLQARDNVPSTDPDYYFDFQDIAAKAGLTYRQSDRLSVGFSLGWFIEKISVYRGSAFNVDLGGQYQLQPNIRIGAAVNNLGSAFNLSAPGAGQSNDIKVPTTARIGGSYTFDRYLGSLDLVVQDDKAHAHVGAEGRLAENFRLRAGYAAGYDSRGASAGASWLHRNFGVNYAFIPFSNGLGTTHMLSLSASL